jgi:hypothetical protein
MDQNRAQQGSPELEDDRQSRNAGPSNDPSHHAPQSGITNRPIEEEQENQDRLPPRGGTKDETSHA